MSDSSESSSSAVSSKSDDEASVSSSASSRSSASSVASASNSSSSRSLGSSSSESSSGFTDKEDDSTLGGATNESELSSVVSNETNGTDETPEVAQEEEEDDSSESSSATSVSDTVATAITSPPAKTGAIAKENSSESTAGELPSDEVDDEASDASSDSDEDNSDVTSESDTVMTELQPTEAAPADDDNASSTSDKGEEESESTVEEVPSESDQEEDATSESDTVMTELSPKAAPPKKETVEDDEHEEDEGGESDVTSESATVMTELSPKAPPTKDRENLGEEDNSDATSESETVATGLPPSEAAPVQEEEASESSASAASDSTECEGNDQSEPRVEDEGSGATSESETVATEITTQKATRRAVTPRASDETSQSPPAKSAASSTADTERSRSQVSAKNRASKDDSTRVSQELSSATSVSETVASEPSKSVVSRVRSKKSEVTSSVSKAGSVQASMAAKSQDSATASPVSETGASKASRSAVSRASSKKSKVSKSGSKMSKKSSAGILNDGDTVSKASKSKKVARTSSKISNNLTAGTEILLPLTRESESGDSEPMMGITSSSKKREEGGKSLSDFLEPKEAANGVSIDVKSLGEISDFTEDTTIKRLSNMAESGGAPVDVVSQLPSVDEDEVDKSESEIDARELQKQGDSPVREAPVETATVSKDYLSSTVNEALKNDLDDGKTSHSNGHLDNDDKRPPQSDDKNAAAAPANANMPIGIHNKPFPTPEPGQKLAPVPEPIQDKTKGNPRRQKSGLFGSIKRGLGLKSFRHKNVPTPLAEPIVEEKGGKEELPPLRDTSLVTAPAIAESKSIEMPLVEEAKEDDDSKYALTEPAVIIAAPSICADHAEPAQSKTKIPKTRSSDLGDFPRFDDKLADTAKEAQKPSSSAQTTTVPDRKASIRQNKSFDSSDDEGSRAKKGLFGIFGRGKKKKKDRNQPEEVLPGSPFSPTEKESPPMAAEEEPKNKVGGFQLVEDEEFKLIQEDVMDITLEQQIEQTQPGKEAATGVSADEPFGDFAVFGSTDEKEKEGVSNVTIQVDGQGNGTVSVSQLSSENVAEEKSSDTCSQDDNAESTIPSKKGSMVVIEKSRDSSKETGSDHAEASAKSSTAGSPEEPIIEHAKNSEEIEVESVSKACKSDHSENLKESGLKNAVEEDGESKLSVMGRDSEEDIESEHSEKPERSVAAGASEGASDSEPSEKSEHSEMASASDEASESEDSEKSKQSEAASTSEEASKSTHSEKSEHSEGPSASEEASQSEPSEHSEAPSASEEASESEHSEATAESEAESASEEESGSHDDSEAASVSHEASGSDHYDESDESEAESASEDASGSHEYSDAESLSHEASNNEETSDSNYSGRSGVSEAGSTSEEASGSHDGSDSEAASDSHEADETKEASRSNHSDKLDASEVKSVSEEDDEWQDDSKVASVYHAASDCEETNESEGSENLDASEAESASEQASGLHDGSASPSVSDRSSNLEHSGNSEDRDMQSGSDVSVSHEGSNAECSATSEMGEVASPPEEPSGSHNVSHEASESEHFQKSEEGEFVSASEEHSGSINDSNAASALHDEQSGCDHVEDGCTSEATAESYSHDSSGHHNLVVDFVGISTDIISVSPSCKSRIKVDENGVLLDTAALDSHSVDSTDNPVQQIASEDLFTGFSEFGVDEKSTESPATKAEVADVILEVHDCNESLGNNDESPDNNPLLKDMGATSRNGSPQNEAAVIEEARAPQANKSSDSKKKGLFGRLGMTLLHRRPSDSDQVTKKKPDAPGSPAHGIRQRPDPAPSSEEDVAYDVEELIDAMPVVAVFTESSSHEGEVVEKGFGGLERETSIRFNSSSDTGDGQFHYSKDDMFSVVDEVPEDDGEGCYIINEEDEDDNEETEDNPSRTSVVKNSALESKGEKLWSFWSKKDKLGAQSNQEDVEPAVLAQQSSVNELELPKGDTQSQVHETEKTVPPRTPSGWSIWSKVGHLTSNTDNSSGPANPESANSSQPAAIKQNLKKEQQNLPVQNTRVMPTKELSGWSIWSKEPKEATAAGGPYDMEKATPFNNTGGNLRDEAQDQTHFNAMKQNSTSNAVDLESGYSTKEPSAFHPSNSPKEKNEPVRPWLKFIVITVLALIGLGGGIGVALFLTAGNDEEDIDDRENDPLLPPSPGPVDIDNPTQPPMESEEMFSFICSYLDNCDPLLDPDTSQGRAFSWLLNPTQNPDLQSYLAYKKITRYALATLFYSTNGETWIDSSNWLTDTDECDWSGTACNEAGDIVALELNENNLQGDMPSEVGLLVSLLTLSFLNPADTIPVIRGDLSSFIGPLSALTSLTISGNDFVGGIPSDIGLLTRLEILDLTSNDLREDVPITFEALSNLKYLNLAQNQLTGALPPGFLRNAAFLTEVSLEGNAFTSFPNVIGGLSNLLKLNLRDNDLIRFPLDVASLTNLESLDMSQNSFGGPIPAALGSLSNLKELSLSGNDFTGRIPIELANLISLSDSLDLSDNALTGPIPYQFNTLTRLEQLYLNSNNLSGSIPSELVRLNQLTSLRIDDNELSGEVPSLFCTLLDNSFVKPVSYADCGELTNADTCFTFCCTEAFGCICRFENSDPLRCVQ